MKLLNVLAVFAFIAMAKGAVTECNSCLEENTANCTTRGVVFSCSNETFPNVGTTHCYTAAAYYMEGNMKKSGVVRGCGNCSANNAMTEAALKKFNATFNEQKNAVLDVDSIKVMCCASPNNCNTQTVSLMSPTTTATTSASVGPSGSTGGTTKPSSHATRLFPISGIVAFVAIFLAVTL